MLLRTLVVGSLPLTVIAQPAIEPLRSDAPIQAHFKKRAPQILRFQGLATYGETLESCRIEAPLLQEQVRLVESLQGSPLLTRPTDLILYLCHDALINAPEHGLRLLSELTKAPLRKDQESLFTCCMLAAGSPGEELICRLASGPDPAWNRFATELLARFAADEASVPRILALLATAHDTDHQASFLRALTSIGSATASKPVQVLLEGRPGDAVMASAAFAYTELEGFKAIGVLDGLKPAGPKSKEEIASSLDWLRKETTPANPHGLEMQGDWEFVERFGDIQSPAMVWMEKHGYFDQKHFQAPTKLSEADTDALLDLLAQSKGFGLEAAKGYLFLSISPRHAGALRQLMALNWYSPNGQTEGRARTLGILLRKTRYMSQTMVP